MAVMWPAVNNRTLALLLATLGTFNRCLGRIDDPSLFDEDDDLVEMQEGPVEIGIPRPVAEAPAGKAGSVDLLGSDC